MTIDEMKENGAKHWKQQALIQVLRAEAEEGFKRITYPIYDKELYKQAYFAAAEPREEKIAALKKENEELWTHSIYLTALIEKMQCCANCENYCQRIDNRCNTECKNHSLWKLNEDFGWRTESN